MSEVVKRYYDGQMEAEWARLAKPYRRFELASTLRLIDEHFPAPSRPSGGARHVADIGGGPGRYTIELLRLGYRVTLCDLSPELVSFARRTLDELGLAADGVHCADARDLDGLETSGFDAALHLGPMYHLIDDQARADALGELHRILKPGAPAIVGFINPWGVLRAGLAEFPSFYADYVDAASLLDTYVKAGEQAAFTESVFVTPPEAMQELRRAGFAVETRAGVEGFASGMQREVAELAESAPETYANVLRLVAETCTRPEYRDCTEHLHVVVRCLK